MITSLSTHCLTARYRSKNGWIQAERMKQILHDHNTIRGDAKADSFTVEKHEDLWIVDFDGSQTDIWVDPEFIETEEGDDMGVERIVNLLHNQDADT